MSYLKDWTAGLSAKDADELVSQLKRAEDVMNRLSSILDQRVDASVARQHSKDLYNSPNWAHMQADSIGYQRALREVVQLITERK